MLTLPQPVEHLLNTWSPTDSVALASVIVLIFLIYLQTGSNNIPTYSLYIPFLTQWRFFANRSDFLAQAFKKAQSSILRLKIIGYPVIVTSGHQARAYFFGDKNLDFSEGYKILMGGVSFCLSTLYLIFPTNERTGPTFGRHRCEIRTSQ